jgi:peptidoglycan/xylan/chitin deacetylase (PgdA/CDA1 family)
MDHLVSYKLSMKKTVAVLGYHKIGEPPGGWYTWSYVSAVTFEAQLLYLSENNWQVIDMPAFLNSITEPMILPERSVLITFDDGYRSNLDVAVPVLQKFNYPAVVFVPTHFIGGYNAFDADISYEPKEAICNWKELKELDKNGISMQSHGVMHRHFSQLTKDEIRTEIVKSKADLENKLGKAIDVFSYPYGDKGLDTNETDIILKDAGYKAAFLYGGKPFKAPISSTYNLARVPIGMDTDMQLALEII